jgi:hypothetical protein
MCQFAEKWDQVRAPEYAWLMLGGPRRRYVHDYLSCFAADKNMVAAGKPKHEN